MADKNWRRYLVNGLAGIFAGAILAAPMTAYATENTGAVADVEVTAEEKREALKDAIIANPGDTINDHKLVAENDNLQLYLYEPTLSVIIRDKKTGAIMESTVGESDGTLNKTWESFIHSGLGFDILNGLNEERSDLTAGGAEISVNYTDNGFSADINLTKYQIRMTLNVTLTDDGFTAEIPNSSIVEEQADAATPVTIGSIYIYPFLGYTYSAERSGYMFVPDGNGSLIYLEDNDGRFSSPQTLSVWGSNAGVDETYVLSLFWDEYQTINDGEPVLAPVFGMVHTDSQMAVLSIIESGAEDSRIIAYPNGAITNYNWITPRFTMRRIYTQLLSKEATASVKLQESRHSQCDLKMRYIFLGGDEADYAGMAVRYREYLLNDQGLTPKDTDFRIKLDFLGSDRENGIIGKKAVTMTTTDNIRDIYDDLAASGVTDITTVYKGWQKGGIWSVPITKYKADSEIGGTHDLTKLVEEANGKGIQFYLYQDALRANPDTVNTTFNIIKKLNESVYEEDTYKEIYEYFNYQTPDKAVERLQSALASYKKEGIKQLALTGITNHLFSYNYNNKLYNRSDTLSVLESAITSAAQDMDILMEQPISEYWGLTSGIMGMPVNTSNYVFTDKEVPFMSIALKGILPMYADYTNFEANRSEYFLELVETGIYPSFYLTWEDPVDLLYTNSSDLYTSKYSVYKSEIVEYYEKLKEVNDAIAGATIVDHQRTADDLAIVTYSNGVKVYVNHSGNAVEYDGMTIEAMSYKVGEVG